MRTLLANAVALCLFAASPLYAEEPYPKEIDPKRIKEGGCLLVVNDLIHIAGPCFYIIEDDGELFVMPSAGAVTGPYPRTYGLVRPTGIASTSLAEWAVIDDKDEMHKQSLGFVKRDRGCWVNDNARICAWR